MNNLIPLIRAMLTGVALLAATAQAAAPDKPGFADTIYTNGRIYTVNEEQPWAEAIAVKDGRFLIVGSNADVKAVTGKNTKVVELGGSFVMPGVHDTHIHPVFPSLDSEAGWMDINPTMSKEELEQTIRDYVRANPGDGWIRWSRVGRQSCLTRQATTRLPTLRRWPWQVSPGTHRIHR